MTHFSIKRRAFILAGSVAFGLAALPGPALALSSESARALVDRVVSDINQVIASGKSESAMIRDFAGIFERYADTTWIAANALGTPWRSASAAQKRSFTAAFTAYISRKYGRRFREFIGGQIEVQGVRDTPRGVEVLSRAVLQGQSPFEVSFEISDASGQPKFINLFIEGINMITSERTEVGAILDRRRGDIDALIADLANA